MLTLTKKQFKNIFKALVLSVLCILHVTFDIIYINFSKLVKIENFVFHKWETFSRKHRILKTPISLWHLQSFKFLQYISHRCVANALHTLVHHKLSTGSSDCAGCSCSLCSLASHKHFPCRTCLSRLDQGRKGRCLVPCHADDFSIWILGMLPNSNCTFNCDRSLPNEGFCKDPSETERVNLLGVDLFPCSGRRWCWHGPVTNLRRGSELPLSTSVTWICSCRCSSSDLPHLWFNS